MEIYPVDSDIHPSNLQAQIVEEKMENDNQRVSFDSTLNSLSEITRNVWQTVRRIDIYILGV